MQEIAYDIRNVGHLLRVMAFHPPLAVWAISTLCLITDNCCLIRSDLFNILLMCCDIFNHSMTMETILYRYVNNFVSFGGTMSVTAGMSPVFSPAFCDDVFVVSV